VGAGLEAAFGPDAPVPALVYLEVLAGLLLVATVLHFRRARGRPGETAAVGRYFAAFFVLLLALPCATVFLSAADPWSALAACGWTLGRTGRGLPIIAVGLPLAVLTGRIGSRDPGLRAMYPLAKSALADARAFAAYEFAYLVLYYLPWEFLFRGLLLLPLVPAVGLLPALALQTAVSTLLHAGHPASEVLAAALAGLAFGLVAVATGSFLYTFVLHAATGIATDTFLFLGKRREGVG
jgi:membrane protease YdiL (CAAX protease family)